MEYIFGFLAIIIILGICSFFSEANQERKEKDQYEFEQRKKADAIALEAQRKSLEYKLQREAEAGLTPVYKEQEIQIAQLKQKNIKYKIIAILLGLILTGISSYIILETNRNHESNESLKGTSEANVTRVNSAVEMKPTYEIAAPSEKNVVQAQKFEEDANIGLANKQKKAVHQINDSEQQSSPSMQILSAKEANTSIGKQAKVCDVVTQISSSSKATFINFGGKYPNHQFSAVVLDSTQINLVENIENQHVCVIGLIESYKGIPQIVIHSFQNQLEAN